MVSRPSVRPDDLRVLFVDDDASIGPAFERQIRPLGYSVELATSGAEALRLAQRYTFPIVVTDLRMPGMDGLTLIERLTPLQPLSVFLVVTGLPELDQRRQEALDGRVLSLIHKPWDADALATALEAARQLYEERLAHGSAPQRRLASDLLLVEDSPADAGLIKAMLNRSGHRPERIVVVDRLESAVSLMSERAFGVVLTDLELPDARGLDAVIQLHRASPETAVVVLSGVDDHLLAASAMRMGAQDYIEKSRLDGPTLERAMRYAAERKRAERQLLYLARYDQLTGLVNRLTFRDRLSHALRRANRREERIAVLFLDLDGLKRINDAHGHDAGDVVIQEVAERMKIAVREVDTVSRLSGDEFAVLLEDVAELEARAVAERILRNVAQSVRLGGTAVTPSVSVGVALFPEAGADSSELLRSADRAMYAAKRAGGNHYFLATGEVQSGSRPPDRSRARESALRDAVSAEALVLYHQPQFDLRSGQLVGAEELLRWPAEDGRLIPPGEFVPLLEHSGLIHRVGAWALERACLHLAEWQAQVTQPLRVAVNLSARQFERPQLVEEVAAAVRGAGVDPRGLELEITESLLMQDTRRTNATLRQLKDLGVRIAIDDFGTGYSSLAYLRRFSVDVLKIDRSFVSDLGADDEASSIIGAVISLGHRLGLEVVAEGVETRTQLEWLTHEGCDVVQGFLTGRPGPELPLDARLRPREQRMPTAPPPPPG